jgi:hypothetical protein
VRDYLSLHNNSFQKRWVRGGVDLNGDNVACHPFTFSPFHLVIGRAV